jgi:hypothetical protein
LIQGAIGRNHYRVGVAKSSQSAVHVRLWSNIPPATFSRIRGTAFDGASAALDSIVLNLAAPLVTVAIIAMRRKNRSRIDT